jgi:Domain of unknown function (DUF4251)
MKTRKINMVSLFWILGLFCISLNSNSQESKLNRQELKEVRKAQMAANFNILDSLLNAKSFVLVADQLQNRIGDLVEVSPAINFIKVDGSAGILQTGSNSRIGSNDVGGTTAEGSIENWKIFTEPKELTHRLTFSILTQIGSYDVSLYVTADNHATATIKGLGPGELTWIGHLETINNSGVFKGRNTI